MAHFSLELFLGVQGRFKRFPLNRVKKEDVCYEKPQWPRISTFSTTINGKRGKNQTPCVRSRDDVTPSSGHCTTSESLKAKMKLNLFKRSMIFATFFGSCLCIALIVASLGTTHWIDARARRSSNTKSEGRISFGLFEGLKELDYGFGLRPHYISVKTGNHPARRWAWLGTAAQLTVALVSSGAACVLAALASAARTRASPRPILACNCATVIFAIGAMAVWLTEYFLRLQHNVMSEEELSHAWSSDGTSELGLSFWLIVATSIAGFVNNVCVLVAMADGRDMDTIAPALEEKVNGAIMLY